MSTSTSTSTSTTLTKSTVTLDVERAVQSGNLTACQKLVASGVDVNVILIAAQLLPAERKDDKKKISEWCLESDKACYIFICDHSVQNDQPRGFKYNKAISMLKGPGEVKKGTFGKSGISQSV